MVRCFSSKERRGAATSYRPKTDPLACYGELPSALKGAKRYADLIEHHDRERKPYDDYEEAVRTRAV